MDYLERTHVPFYLRDACLLLAEHLAECPRESAVGFLSNYFSSVISGDNVVFREYEYVQATPRNRRAFIGLVWQTYKHLAGSKDVFTVSDCYALVSLLCQDFPIDIVHQSARPLEDGAMIAFGDFVYSFQVEFFLWEYLGALSSTFLALQHACDRTAGVPVAQILGESAKIQATSVLSVEVLQSALTQSHYLSFSEVRASLNRSEAVNAFIRALPRKGSEESKGRRPKRNSNG
eukprot:m.112029 g.112029  ORF g.112029 m.112029 type:complete len:233 (-) comp9102_c0_seq6:106-804(-)